MHAIIAIYKSSSKLSRNLTLDQSIAEAFCFNNKVGINLSPGNSRTLNNNSVHEKLQNNTTTNHVILKGKSIDLVSIGATNLMRVFITCLPYRVCRFYWRFKELYQSYQNYEKCECIYLPLVIASNTPELSKYFLNSNLFEEKSF